MSEQKLKIAVVGAGVGGLSAAFDLLNAGHQVTIYEADGHTGGLAAGFRDETWDWPLEKFYHHLFTSDKEMIRLVAEIGMKDKLFFHGRSPPSYTRIRLSLLIHRRPGSSFPVSICWMQPGLA